LESRGRRPRIEFESGFYHVITRGKHREKIFLDEKRWDQGLPSLRKLLSWRVSPMEIPGDFISGKKRC